MLNVTTSQGKGQHEWIIRKAFLFVFGEVRLDRMSVRSFCRYWTH